MVVIADDWVRVRVTRRGNSGKMKIYVDSVQKLGFTDKDDEYTLRKGRIVLFRDNPGSGEHSWGTVSTIKLWKRVVTP